MDEMKSGGANCVIPMPHTGPCRTGAPELRDQTNAIAEQIREVKRGITLLQLENEQLRKVNLERDVERRTIKFLLTHTADPLVDNDYTHNESGCRVFTPPDIAACLACVELEISLDAEHAG